MSRRTLAEIVKDRDPQVFAQNVRRARESLGWTRGQLCKEAGVSPQTLTRVERGEGCTPGVERKLAAALGTVIGRLWQVQELPRQIVHRLAEDRWYFAGHADGERYWAHHGLVDDLERRYDPDAIQDTDERSRMGSAGLASGFVRVTTAHLRVGSVISSVIDLYGRVDASLPEGRLAYFHILRGAVRFTLGERVELLGEGDVFQVEMAASAWLEPAAAVGSKELPPRLIFVDLEPRRNKVASGSA